LPLKYSKHFQIVFASILSTNWEALGHEKRLLSTKKSRFNSVIPIYQDRKKSTNPSQDFPSGDHAFTMKP
jgi:hypothetical protein